MTLKKTRAHALIYSDSRSKAVSSSANSRPIMRAYSESQWERRTEVNESCRLARPPSLKFNLPTSILVGQLARIRSQSPPNLPPPPVHQHRTHASLLVRTTPQTRPRMIHQKKWCHGGHNLEEDARAWIFFGSRSKTGWVRRVQDGLPSIFEHMTRASGRGTVVDHDNPSAEVTTAMGAGAIKRCWTA